MVSSEVVRILTIVVGVAVGAMPAYADERGDLQAKGEAQAKDGRFADAIESFKAADRIEPRAVHACLIALAYSRRELWPQAELFWARCQDRAKAGETLPDWIPLAEEKITSGLRAANIVQIAIEVMPATAKAQVTVSSFAPDEVFEPRTIYLPPGTHVVFVKAEGFGEAQRTVEVKPSAPQRVTIELTPVGVVTEKLPVTPPPPRAKKPGTVFLIAGGAAIALGIGAHAWMAFERGALVDADEANDRDAYDSHSGKFDIARIATVGLYVAGAALIVTGIVKRTSTKTESTRVSAVPLEGGGFVSVGWTR